MECWNWADQWLGDGDVCELRDKVGLIVGLFSVVCWALAEIPQLLVNALENSSDGLSEGLLWLWVFSDILDVIGCTISDTLPTMLLTAWMYFIFTVMLLLQHLYFTRIRPAPGKDQACEDLEHQAPLLLGGLSEDEDDLVAELYGPPILMRHGGSRHTVYGSLRNLSIRRSSSSSSLSLSDTGRRLQDSFLHRRGSRLRRLAGTTSADAAAAMLRPASADAAVAGLPDAPRCYSMPQSFSGAAAATKLMAGLALVSLVALGWHTGSSSAGGNSSSMSRSLLAQGELPDGGRQFWGISYAVWGSIMGWTMAATFFLGRVPQVIKNWRRKSCAGLSFEMFVVVLTAAATYCASILLRVRSWSDLLPKLPFLTDAALGALLDIVILAQFVMYKDADSSDAGSSGGGGKAGGSQLGQLGGSGSSCSSKLGLLPGDKLTSLLGDDAWPAASRSSSILIHGTAAADVLVLDQARSDSDAQSMLSIATI